MAERPSGTGDSGGAVAGIRRPHPWEASYPAGVRWDKPIATGTLPDLLARAVACYGDKPCIEYGGKTLSYAGFAELVQDFTRGFLSLGLGFGARIGLHLPNVPLHPLTFFGALAAGATVVHLSPLDAERELAHKLADSGARTVVTLFGPDLLPKIVRLRNKGLVDRIIVGHDWNSTVAPGSVPETDFDARIMLHARDVPLLGRRHRPATPTAVRPEDLALLQYTGGTTGVPKAAMLTHTNLTAAVAIIDAWSRPQRLFLDGEERMLGVLPLFHLYAITSVLLNGIHHGAEILLRRRFDVDQTLRDIEERRVTTFAGVPTMWIAIANHPGVEQRDLSSLRNVRSGGAACPIEIEQRIERLTGRRLAGGWGMTETSPVGANIPLHRRAKYGTIGLPLPGVTMDVVALDDPRRVLPPGEKGEIRIKGPNVTQGYLNRPEETAAAFVDGWLLTGDVGYMDAEGFFFLVDRKKDLIISGGFNIYPRAIEEAIYEHPAVAEVIVIGVPDAYRGEAAKAFVRLRGGAAPFTLAELRGFLADKLGRPELPAHLEFRDTLPRTAVGKLSKKELVAEERARRTAEESA